MKKRIAILLLIALVLSFSAGCAKKAATVDLGDESAVLLTVEGTSVKSITLGEFLKLKQMTVTLSRTNSKGETVKGTYTGVHFNTLRQALGITSFSSIELVASDGYKASYTADLLEDPTSVFAVIQDGKAIDSRDNGRVWFCGSENFTANYWCKYVVKIVVKP